jgi:hypothetical protein
MMGGDAVERRRFSCPDCLSEQRYLIFEPNPVEVIICDGCGRAFYFVRERSVLTDYFRKVRFSPACYELELE